MLLTDWIQYRTVQVWWKMQYGHVLSMKFIFSLFLCFYRAMLCIRGTCHGPVSVCVCLSLSVTSRSSTKMAKRRITQTTPHDSLVFWCQRSPRNSTGITPCGSAKCRWGGSNSWLFRLQHRSPSQCSRSNFVLDDCKSSYIELLQDWISAHWSQ